MVIDLILDRRDGCKYNPRQFYLDVCQYAAGFDSPVMWEISKQMDEGTEQAVKHALCSYIFAEGYSPEICDYINSVNWL